MIPLYAEFILPADLSLLEILDPAEQFVYGILNLGLVQAFYRYFPESDDPEFKKRIISTLFWFLTGMGFIVCTILYLTADSVIDVLLPAHSLAKICFLLTLISLFVRFLSMLSSGFMNSTEQADQYSLWNIVGTILLCTYNTYFLWFMQADIDAVFEARIFSQIPLTLAGIWMFRNSLRFEFDWGLFKKMLNFSYPFILTAVSFPILTYFDRWMLSELESPAATGIYGISYRFALVPGMLLVNPFLKAWRPFIYNYDDAETQQVVYKRILLYYGFIGCLLWIGISVFGREIIHLFTSEAYYAGYVIIPYVASSKLLNGLGWIVIARLTVHDKTLFIGFCSLTAAILNVVLNYFMIPDFGIMGAAYATMIAYIFIFLGYSLYSYWEHPLNWPMTRLAGMVTLSIAGYYGISHVQMDSIWITILVKGLLILPLIPILMWLAGLTWNKMRSLLTNLDDQEQ